MRLDRVEDIKELFNQLISQPTSDAGLFKKARIFNCYHINVGLDYVLVDDCTVTCSELFLNILMRDLSTNTSLGEKNDTDFLDIRFFLRNVLRTRKSGVIWRFVSADVNVRSEFLMTLDVRKCPLAKKYFEELFLHYLEGNLE